MRFSLAALTIHVIGCIAAACADEPSEQGLELVEVKRIWDAAPHNAFTDLIRFQGRWYCAFREGQGHVSPDGKLRVLVSSDGDIWKSAALLDHNDGDARDAKLSIAPDGRLMLSGAVAWHKPRDGHTYHSLVWFSKDGADWTEPQEIGEPDFWIWAPTWHEKTGYGVGYGCGKEHIARLYSTTDGRDWKPLVANLFPDGGYPSEASLVFDDDHTCYCLLRRDEGDAAGQFGVAQPPYTEWTWKSVGQHIGGPKLIQLPDDRLLAAGRTHQDGTHTTLGWIDAKAGTFQPALRLPSGGDTSYPGMFLHNGFLWVSYYSGHEGKSNIYLAKVRVADR